MENVKDMPKVSFRVSDPETARILNVKKQNGEMSAYINEALRFYRENYQEMLEIKREIKTIKEMLKAGVVLAGADEGKRKEENIIDTLLINGLDAFLNR